VGRLWVTGDVGLRPWTAVPGLAATAQFWTEPGDFRTFLPRRRVTSHKGDFGHVVVIAGSRGYHGAAVLAARGALRARPGRVTVLTPPDVYPQVASQLAAAMVAPWSGDSPLPAGPSALLAGPGLAAADLPDSLRREVVRCWQEAPCPMVADASALDWLPPRNGAAPALRVITPHPGEAGRLLGMGATEVQQDRVGVVRRLSRRFGDCLVVLKGHQSLVGGAEGPLHVNSSGNPGLAQGGSGDVLGGYLAGLLGQPALQEIPSLTVRYGVWEHGATADILEGERGNWTSEDLAEALGDARWD
ncbi:MAG: NAD(P)H-hydrate dehydratase, partial [Verrucomicrobiota bacterium]